MSLQTLALQGKEKPFRFPTRFPSLATPALSPIPNQSPRKGRVLKEESFPAGSFVVGISHESKVSPVCIDEIVPVSIDAFPKNSEQIQSFHGSQDHPSEKDNFQSH